MKDTKKENTTNGNINPQADTLTDLPLADEPANGTKGGHAGTDDYTPWRSRFGSGL